MGFQPFVIMYLITAATIFGKIPTNQDDITWLAWWLDNAPPPTPNSPAIAELLSAVFRSVRLTVPQSFNMFQASHMCLHFIKNKLSRCFTFWGYFIFLLLVLCELLEPNRCFTLNTDSEACDGITGPN